MPCKKLKQSLDNIFIIHFSPAEMYPPLQNFIRVLHKQDPSQAITVITTSGKFEALRRFSFPHPNVRILRFGASGPGISKLTRWWTYLFFYLGCSWQLLIKRPAAVLYYETLSSFPVYLYKRYTRRDARVLIHYHEYTSPREYRSGMALSRIFHRYEQWLYPMAEWVSHTHPERLKMFLEDIMPLKINNPQIVPNYPPASWYQFSPLPLAFPVRFLYTGALSLHSMYTREMAEWVIAQKGAVVWDIYAYNLSGETASYIRNLGSPWVNLKGSKDYNNC